MNVSRWIGLLGLFSRNRIPTTCLPKVKLARRLRHDRRRSRASSSAQA